MCFEEDVEFLSSVLATPFVVQNSSVYFVQVPEPDSAWAFDPFKSDGFQMFECFRPRNSRQQGLVVG